ncbi:tetratricopeptide repeat protein [Desmonostoc muscorum CCALA 125]|nr:tetratricopeptide repeat protein [Desmonostoc muscorum CCALA 125]
MKIIAEQVKQRLEQLNKNQAPIYLYKQNWDGDREEYCIETLTSPQNLPRSGVKKFVGREQALATLHQQLQQTQRVAITTVTGMGGIGKSELALQYAQHHWQEGTYPGGVCWLRVRDEDLGTQIVAFARAKLGLQLPDDWDLPTRINYIWGQWQAGDVLLVFDDVSKYEQVKPYLPPTEPRFKILITTRQQWLGQSFERLCLEVLEEVAALELLVSFVGDERIQRELHQAKQLCADLGFLPLGLELVARYLQRKPDVSLAKMRQRLADKLLTHRSMQEPSTEMTAQRGVIAAFELSWQELDKQAQNLGCLLSIFALAPIPWYLVERSLPNQDSEDLEDVRDDYLVNLSLLQRTGEETYQLHQLIRKFLSDKLKELAEADELKRGYCQAMVAVGDDIPQTPTLIDIAKVTLAIPHLAEAATVYQAWLSDDDLISPFVGLARFYEGQGAYAQALPWCKQSLSSAKKRLGESNLDVATSLNNLAELYKSQGRYSKAEPLYIEALQMRKRLLRQSHPDVAQSLNNLGLLYYLQGRYSQAEPLYIQALEMRKSLLCPSDNSLATILNNLAGLYNSQERYSEAESLYIQALEIAQQWGGESRPDVVQILNNLAFLYHSQGRYSEAESLYIQALEMRKRLLGKSHPDVAQSLNNLAELYRIQRRYSEAKPLLIEALEMEKRLLGESHPYVATSLNNLGLLYHSQEHYSEAEPLYIEALEMRKRLLGEFHPNVVTSLNNLAELYCELRRYSEAEPLYIQALEMRKRLLGESHPDVAQSLNNLAFFYHSQTKGSEAEPLYIQALEIAEQQLGANHPYTMTIRENLEYLRRNRQP